VFNDPRFEENLDLLAEMGLSFELLLRCDQLELAAELVSRHPQLRFVLDHLGNPPVGLNTDGWQAGLTSLAMNANVVVKLSGLTDDVGDRSWDEHSFDRCFDVAAQCFGADRLLFGSNWPLVLTNSSIHQWCDIVLNWISRQCPAARDDILWNNAVRAYRLDLP
jgi:L-fuconolactonase